MMATPPSHQCHILVFLISEVLWQFGGIRPSKYKSLIFVINKLSFSASVFLKMMLANVQMIIICLMPVAD